MVTAFIFLLRNIRVFCSGSMTISILLNYCMEVINIMSRTMSELKVKFRNWHIFFYNNINL